MEFDLGRKACGMTENKINYFNQLVRSAGQLNSDHSKCLFREYYSQETVRKTYRERKNPKATHIAPIRTENHFRFPNCSLAAASGTQLAASNGPARKTQHPAKAKIAISAHSVHMGMQSVQAGIITYSSNRLRRTMRDGDIQSRR